MQAKAGQEPAVIVEKGNQVNAAILSLQNKREQIGLPELIGHGPLKAMIGWRVRPVRRHVVEDVAGLAQNTGHGGGTGGQGGATQEHVADLLAAPVGVGLLEQQNGALGQFGEFAAGGAAAWLVGQSDGSEFVEAFLPGIEGVLGESDQGGEVAGWQSGSAPGVEDEKALLRCERGGALGVRGGDQAFAVPCRTGQPWCRPKVVGRIGVGVVSGG